MPKLAANLSFLFTEVSFLDRFAAARGNGFDAVEFLFPYAFGTEAIAERLARYNLQTVLHNFPSGDWNAGDRGLACDPRRISEFQDSVGLALEYALELNVPRLHCLAGLLPEAIAPELAHATYVANLRQAAAALDAHGLQLLIEPINHFDMPGYFLTSSDQAAAVIAEAGAPNLAMQFDMYHLQRMGEDVAHALQAHFPLIGHVQLADLPGRNEPGSGAMDWRSLLSLLDGMGYRGWVGCEYHPRADTIAGLAWRSAMA